MVRKSVELTAGNAERKAVGGRLKDGAGVPLKVTLLGCSVAPWTVSLSATASKLAPNVHCFTPARSHFGLSRRMLKRFVQSSIVSRLQPS